MALLLPHSVFIHIPKTGGNWVRNVLSRCCLIVRDTADSAHATHATLGDLPALDIHVGENFPSFAFVRHPAAWFRSYWAFKLRNGWDVPVNTFDRDCQDPTLHGFIRKVIERYPGFLTQEYRKYTAGVTYVGRMESMLDDLMYILGQIGEPFDPDTVSATPAANVTGSGYVGTGQSTYSLELLNAVLASEREALEEWGYGLHGYGRV